MKYNGKRILSILSWYPLMWTIAILFGAFFNILHPYLIRFIMATWALYVYGGLLLWIGLLVYLPLKKKISVKQCAIHFLIFIIGTIAAYYVVVYDIFGSGVKYID